LSAAILHGDRTEFGGWHKGYATIKGQDLLVYRAVDPLSSTGLPLLMPHLVVCPKCGAYMAVESVLCIQCGHNQRPDEGADVGLVGVAANT
jgi:ribosomal protein L32